jgi:hypothetical protein
MVHVFKLGALVGGKGCLVKLTLPLLENRVAHNAEKALTWITALDSRPPILLSHEDLQGQILDDIGLSIVKRVISILFIRSVWKLHLIFTFFLQIFSP